MPLPLEPPTELPRDGVGYRVKRKLLGPPLHTEQLEHERLGKPTRSRCSRRTTCRRRRTRPRRSCACSCPRSGSPPSRSSSRSRSRCSVVLGFLILSVPPDDQGVPDRRRRVHGDARQLRAAARAGRRGRPPHRLRPHGSVSVAAGTAAVASAFSALTPYVVPDLGRVRRAHRVRQPARRARVGPDLRGPDLLLHPEHVVLLGWGLSSSTGGTLPEAPQPRRGHGPVRQPGDGLLLGATLFVVLHAFASGGAAVTGVEAISNGVPAFRKPAWKNARTTLVIMGTLSARCSSGCRSSPRTCTSRPSPRARRR